MKKGGEYMFCYNCGKEIQKGHNFCQYCGTKLNNVQIKEKVNNIDDQTTKNNSNLSNENVKQEQLSMNWFEFYRTFCLVFIIITGIISSTQLIQFLNVNVVTFILIMIIILSYVIMPIVLFLNLPKMKSYAHTLLMIYLILDYAWRVLNVALYTAYNNSMEDLAKYAILAVLILGCWFIPNLIYFGKRTKLFNK